MGLSVAGSRSRSATWQHATKVRCLMRIQPKWRQIQNVTDEDAPIFPSPVQANTDPSQYDVFGRRYYASLRYSF